MHHHRTRRIAVRAFGPRRRVVTRPTEPPVRALVERLEQRVLLSTYEVVPDSSGNVYFATDTGGLHGYGAVREIDHATGAVTTLASFDTPGQRSALLRDNSGNLFGWSAPADASDGGTIFEVSKGSAPGWALTTLASFHGERPFGPLVQDASGNLYGTAGTLQFPHQNDEGSVFELSNAAGGAGWTFSTIASFTGRVNNTNLVIDANGNLYGTIAVYNPNYDGGSVFELSKAANSTWKITNPLHSIATSVNADSMSRDANGNFFFTTANGGSQSEVLELPSGAPPTQGFRTLASFDGGLYAGLAVDAAGNLYGSTYVGGANGAGYVFELANNGGQSWTFSQLASFGADGSGFGLVLGDSGDLFGMSSDGWPFEVVKGLGSSWTLLSFDPFTVQNLNDNGPGSLRYAIEHANGDPGPDTINVADGLSGDITLGGTELEISDDVTIKGTGSVTIDGNGASQVLQVDPGVAAEIDSVEIRGGKSGGDGGGGIANYGHLTLAHCQIDNNSGSFGGGIANYGDLTLTACLIDQNKSYYFGGGSGGGIYNVGSLTMSDCGVSGNSALGGIGGGIFNIGTLTMARTNVAGNLAKEQGGGIENEGTLTLNDVSVVSQNSAGAAGGGIDNDASLSITDSVIESNSVGGPGPLTGGATAGGGIQNNADGTVALVASEVDNNTAFGNGSSSTGGGVANYGTLTLLSSSIWGNFADLGAALSNTGTLTIADSALYGNRALGDGGAIENSQVPGFASPDLSIFNSTLWLNSAFGSGGAIDSPSADSLLLTNCTISNNRATFGGGVNAAGTKQVVLRNTIVAGNFLAATSIPNDINGSVNTVQSGYNLIGAGGSGGLVNAVNGNIVGVADPKLAPPGDYGGSSGPTVMWTMPPLPGSPAIDAGSNALAVGADGNALTTDQRGAGYPRLSGAAVDIGAVELTQLAGNDLYLRLDADGGGVDVWRDSSTPGVGVPTLTLPLGARNALEMLGTSGNDVLTLDFSNGNPILTNPALNYDGRGGNDTLVIVGGAGNDTLMATEGGIAFASTAPNVLAVSLPLAGVRTLRFLGGGGSDTFTIAGGDYLVDAESRPGAPGITLNVAAGAIARLTSDQNLAGLGVNGLLDIGGNKLWTTTPAATIRGYLKSGCRANQDWAGTTGITSSLAAGNPTKYTIGYADGNDRSAQDAGITVWPGLVLVQPTLVGDANLDGTVNFLDLAQLLGYKFNTHQPASYTDGDLNYDGTVNFLDLATLLSANYNTGQTFTAAAAAASAIAEPATPIETAIPPLSAVFPTWPSTTVPHRRKHVFA
jgi:uncharacterized repeat protein (TIGR03803 family)